LFQYNGGNYADLAGLRRLAPQFQV
jgi:hypothetical protein